MTIATACNLFDFWIKFSICKSFSLIHDLFIEFWPSFWTPFYLSSEVTFNHQLSKLLKFRYMNFPFKKREKVTITNPKFRFFKPQNPQYPFSLIRLNRNIGTHISNSLTSKITISLKMECIYVGARLYCCTNNILFFFLNGTRL